MRELVAAEWFERTGPLTHDERGTDDTFVGRVPAATFQALATATNRASGIGRARINNLVIIVSAEWAVHAL